MWPDTRIQELFDIEFPIVQAPMAGANGSAMAIAVAEAGGLGSLPCALLTPDQLRAELGAIRAGTRRPVNVNFFCHRPPQPDVEREAAWRHELSRYYVELGLDPDAPVPASSRAPFDDEFCGLVEELRPEIVSFHFGLPERRLLNRVRATRARIVSSATTVREARWLEDAGCDAIIAQGAEAGGHRGMFLAEAVDRQVGTMALVPQVVDAVKVPVIAAGGIADGRGIAAALALGAAAVQVGTAYLFCPESTVADPHREALRSAHADDTVLTNVFTGRPARSIVNRTVREVGPLSPLAPAFPLAGGALAPLRSAAPSGSADFMSLWSGQGVALRRELTAADLTRVLAQEALARLSSLTSGAAR
ncbi:NAD(P)H-dependent flavin oxidoreductase [Roseitranquillus sediminis]|uniref:NAD(P)H-dependent flavin oxidoreductase n=1 Tax=Roseitranquillus sediminis TaxID=2809051 RepID=UPI001D0C0FF3|nr:nitronate monooxygenase family protein [Roseitranquillus sediminis]MBM9595972.1 nitronate monooxygenase [Roseitranquillus sediminis]